MSSSQRGPLSPPFDYVIIQIKFINPLFMEMDKIDGRQILSQYWFFMKNSLRKRTVESYNSFEV